MSDTKVSWLYKIDVSKNLSDISPSKPKEIANVTIRINLNIFQRQIVAKNQSAVQNSY